MITVEVRTVVVGSQVVEVELETDDRPRSLGLSVRVDGAKRWSSEEPGWREIGLGVDDGLFVWTARRLVVVPLGADDVACSVDTDEDIVAVFRVGAGWLLVCETSIRLVLDDAERSRLELPDVFADVRWSGRHLLVRCVNEASVRVAVAVGELEALPD